jgi:hypothetical protein
MAQVALELAYSFFVEVLCYGTGSVFLRCLGFRELGRREYIVGVVGFLFWFIVGLLVWHFFSV